MPIREQRRVDEPAVRANPVDDARSRLDELNALPLPGRSHTEHRWRALARIGREDLSLARLVEGHVDARAILTELGRLDQIADDELLGVWAAEPDGLEAARTPGGWRLNGTKRWCSGSKGLDRALLTATADDGSRLFVMSPQAAHVEPGSWRPMGMAPTVSETIELRRVDVPASAAIGGPGAYVQRPGFGHGGCGVAACWWGGALGVLDGLHHAVAEGGDGDAAAALGSSVAELSSAGRTLAAAARAIDAQPKDVELAQRLAREVRLVVEHAARGVLDRTVESLGAAGLCQDPEHSTRIADLTVYLSQHRRRPAATTHGRASATEPLGLTW